MPPARWRELHELAWLLGHPTAIGRFKRNLDRISAAGDQKHLGARIGITSVLHTWGSAMTHHPHVHVIVPGGGISSDGQHWVSCRLGFFLPVRVLSQRIYQERNALL